MYPEAAGVLIADLPSQPGANMRDDRWDRAGRRAARFLNAFQYRRQIADRNPLLQQRLQHALHRADRDRGGDHVMNQLLMLGRQLVQ